MSNGQVAERSIARDCKSLGATLRRFKSFPSQFDISTVVMNIPDREELEQELEQLRINRAIEKSSWFAHKSYAEELIQTL